MTVSHWPTTLIGPGGESEIVSHFVESIFSGSWVGKGEKSLADVPKTDRGLLVSMRLEHFQRCSVCNPAQCQWMKK